MPALVEGIDQVRTDKARSACYENAA